MSYNLPEIEVQCYNCVPTFVDALYKNMVSKNTLFSFTNLDNGIDNVL